MWLGSPFQLRSTICKKLAPNHIRKTKSISIKLLLILQSLFYQIVSKDLWIAKTSLCSVEFPLSKTDLRLQSPHPRIIWCKMNEEKENLKKRKICIVYEELPLFCNLMIVFNFWIESQVKTTKTWFEYGWLIFEKLWGSSY